MSLRSVTRAVAGVLIPAAGLILVCAAGCSTEPTFAELRAAGQQQVIEHNVGVAKRLFEEAEELRREDAYNLHDLGICAMIRARDLFSQGHHPAAMREIDQSIAYYDRAITVHPGFQSALLGKKRALKLKGQFDAALRHAEWVSVFVGPAAEQQIFLARELEERGDMDAALLRYRQAVAMEEDHAGAHAELGRFLHRQGRGEAAIPHLQESYRLDPTDREVLRLLVELGAPIPRGPTALTP
jgi:tetratricopeptide (TPR) repeat protein